MRNLLFVLVFVSITILGCGENKSPLENCADQLYARLNSKENKELNLLEKSYKKKLQNNSYYNSHRVCETKRERFPKSFDAKYQ
tara:strand:- start:139 stop:390 length:252 start_codon:yes stop_codon:yes gene_type:complete